MVNSDEIPSILAERKTEQIEDTNFALETEGRRALIAGVNQAVKGAVKGEDYVDEKNPQRRLQSEIFKRESTAEETNGEQPETPPQGNTAE